MRFHVLHRTRYLYAAAVRDSYNEVRLRPAEHPGQEVESFRLRVLPAAPVREYRDYHGNWVQEFAVVAPHESLLVESELVARTQPGTGPDGPGASVPWEGLAVAGFRQEHWEFLQPSQYVELSEDVVRLARGVVAGTGEVGAGVEALVGHVHGAFAYTPEVTTARTRLREVLELRRGVCQDLAHVTVGLCRAVGVPARYVSGYLACPGANASHAWVEVAVPGAGWRAWDPTHRREPDATYIRLAIGRDYGDVQPVRGQYRGTQERRLEVEVQITPLPRPG